MTSRVPVLLLLLTIAFPLAAADATRDGFVVVAGRTTGATRTFDTTLWLSNATNHRADVTVSFLRGEQANPSPHALSLSISAHGVAALPVASNIIGAPEGLGALHVVASRDVAAEARITSSVAGDTSRKHAMTLRAIPSQYAIGSGESTAVQGVGSGEARLYVVETTGLPLYFTVTVVDAHGQEHGQKRWLLSGREQRAFDVQHEFPNAPAGAALLRIRGVNGSGKIVAAVVVTIPESQDLSVFEMLLPSRARHRLGVGELAAYALVALAILAAVVRARR
ncbi:MAG TPA: hypothetical protein VFN10_13055 [Thermoanaerobaculia bacterium]|nr:hypothetical protein [Thermoanaerobaculia bacterium]